MTDNANIDATILTDAEKAMSPEEAIASIKDINKLRAYMALHASAAKATKAKPRKVTYSTGEYKGHFMLQVNGDGKPFQKGVNGVLSVLKHQNKIEKLLAQDEGFKQVMKAMGANLFQTEKILRHREGLMALIKDNLDDDRVRKAVEKHK